MDDDKHRRASLASPTAVDGRPPYSPPRVILYSEEELLQRLGPVKACASFGLFGRPPQQPRENPPGGDRRFQFDV